MAYAFMSRRWLALIAGLGASLASTTAALAQQEQIKVDWGHAEISSYVREQVANPRPSVLPDQASRLSRLQLPVLGFERAPASIVAAAGVGRTPEAKRKLVMDEANPIWYNLIERYGDITITIDADLRLQDKLPPAARVFVPPADDGQISDVTIMDSTTEPGLTGAVAEFSIRKFNIPYRVTMECNQAAREVCRNPQAIARDGQLLKLLSARPPQ
jgi:hypothetical protein